jgi:hypothetical protein
MAQTSPVEGASREGLIARLLLADLDLQETKNGFNDTDGHHDKEKLRDDQLGAEFCYGGQYAGAADRLCGARISIFRR